MDASSPQREESCSVTVSPVMSGISSVTIVVSARVSRFSPEEVTVPVSPLRDPVISWEGSSSPSSAGSSPSCSPAGSSSSVTSPPPAIPGSCTERSSVPVLSVDSDSSPGISSTTGRFWESVPVPLSSHVPVPGSDRGSTCSVNPVSEP